MTRGSNVYAKSGCVYSLNTNDEPRWMDGAREPLRSRRAWRRMAGWRRAEDTQTVRGVCRLVRPSRRASAVFRQRQSQNPKEAKNPRDELPAGD
ncbi:hypothetical protein Q1695_016063 [Nippostrongylus brasiliensis]|nr:hypothetical protein Q1695_016063 [Nippostrongylus brasiliensis]